MSANPLRHMLLLTALLFVVLSSSQIQRSFCSCESYACPAPGSMQATDCHPLYLEVSASNPVSSFCHRSHSSSQAQNEPVLIGLSNGQALALFNSQSQAPQYRSAEPFLQRYASLTSAKLQDLEILPDSQKEKQLRSTILLI
jgi:hypothetical protein